jgi:hypothetical protein
LNIGDLFSWAPDLLPKNQIDDPCHENSLSGQLSSTIA